MTHACIQDDLELLRYLFAGELAISVIAPEHRRAA